jgi:hypothetical protein
MGKRGMVEVRHPEREARAPQKLTRSRRNSPARVQNSGCPPSRSKISVFTPSRPSLPPASCCVRIISHRGLACYIDLLSETTSRGG